LPVDRGIAPDYYHVQLNAVVAQLVERLLAMQKVVSSNLISRSIFKWSILKSFQIFKGTLTSPFFFIFAFDVPKMCQEIFI
jgi:hypothetical protein